MAELFGSRDQPPVHRHVDLLMVGKTGGIGHLEDERGETVRTRKLHVQLNLQVPVHPGDETLAAELHLQWVREFPPPRPAWPKEPLRLSFDATYEPIALGDCVYISSMVEDCVTALDAASGKEKWRFFAGGPVRFAPVGWKGNVYFVSDDGYLYCVSAGAGRLKWKVRGLPESKSNRLVLGNRRMISLWPARGGPVLSGGTIYFAAGIWPSSGIYIYAVDAETGKVRWCNSEVGLLKGRLDDHNRRPSPSGDTGLAPQGYFAVSGDRLIVPSSRAQPGFLDRNTGKLAAYGTGWGGREKLAKGCWYVAANSRYYVQSGDLWGLSPRKRHFIDPANFKGLKPFRHAG